MDALIAAYREGLALAAVAVLHGGKGLRIATLPQGGALPPGEKLVARWWCRRPAEAEYLADSAARSFRRSRQKSADESALACEAVRRAADRSSIQIRSDEDVAEEAGRAMARLDAEIDKQMRSGALKSVNQSYRQYRLDASSRGERVLPYAKWMHGYKIKLMREIAATMRHL
jgi:hypothetical protein